MAARVHRTVDRVRSIAAGMTVSLEAEVDGGAAFSRARPPVSLRSVF
jgi:hypothetical protein